MSISDWCAGVCSSDLVVSKWEEAFIDSVPVRIPAPSLRKERCRGHSPTCQARVCKRTGGGYSVNSLRLLQLVPLRHAPAAASGSAGRRGSGPGGDGSAESGRESCRGGACKYV